MMKMYSRNTSVESEIESSGDEYSPMEVIDEMLTHAVKEDRLVLGVFECAHVLETCPDVVELCVLPNAKSDNISVNIQHKLIEAYCWENDIKVIKLDPAQFKTNTKMSRNKTLEQSDLECALVTSTANFVIADDLNDSMDGEQFG